MTDPDVYIEAVGTSGTEKHQGKCLSIGVLSTYFTAMKAFSGLAYGQLEMLLSVT